MRNKPDHVLARIHAECAKFATLVGIDANVPQASATIDQAPLRAPHDVKILEELHLHTIRRLAVGAEDAPGNRSRRNHVDDGVLNTLTVRDAEGVAGNLLAPGNHIAFSNDSHKMSSSGKSFELEASAGVGCRAHLRLIRSAHEKNAHARDRDVGTGFADSPFD